MSRQNEKSSVPKIYMYPLGWFDFQCKFLGTGYEERETIEMAL